MTVGRPYTKTGASPRHESLGGRLAQAREQPEGVDLGVAPSPRGSDGGVSTESGLHDLWGASLPVGAMRGLPEAGGSALHPGARELLV